MAYYKKGDYDRAIVDYDLALRLNPQDADAYNNRGLVYYNKRDYDLAIADYDSALAIDTNEKHAENNKRLAEAARDAAKIKR